jgi:hypothetical protein
MESKPTQPQITLFRGWKDTTRYAWSPFVTKLEFRMRYAGITYTGAGGSPRSAPTGKIPYVEVQWKDQSPTAIGDSSLIAKYFEDEGLLGNLNATLSGVGRAHDLAIKALVEDRLYFFNMRERWIDNFYTHRDGVLEAIPYSVRVFVGWITYRSICKTLYGQGTGRFSAAEAKGFREEIWTNLNAMLEESRRKSQVGECFWCLGGELPTECDMSVFGFVNSALIANR